MKMNHYKLKKKSKKKKNKKKKKKDSDGKCIDFIQRL